MTGKNENTPNPVVIDSGDRGEQALVDRGVLKLGLPRDPDAYRSPRPPLRLEDLAIDDALNWTRGEG